MSEAKATKNNQTKHSILFSSLLGFCFFLILSFSNTTKKWALFPRMPSTNSKLSWIKVFPLSHLLFPFSSFSHPFFFLFFSPFFLLNCFFLTVLLEEEPLQRTFQVTILAIHLPTWFYHFIFFCFLGVCLLILISLLCLTRVNCMSCFNGFCILLAFEPWNSSDCTCVYMCFIKVVE